MFNISWHGYLYSQPDSAAYFAQLQYDFAKSKGLKKHMAGALNTQGASYYLQGKYEQALAYYGKCLKLYEELGDKKRIASSYNNIGIIYDRQGNYGQTLEYFRKSLKTYGEAGDKKGMATSYNNIGNIYKQQDKYKQALEYYNKALLVYEERGNKEVGMADLCNNIGVIYGDQGNYDQALSYYGKSLKIKEEMGNKQGMASSYLNMGVLYYYQGNYQEALAHYTKGLKIHTEMGNKVGIANSCINLGSLSLNQENYPEAITLGKKALALAQKTGAVVETREASDLLFKLYKKIGQPAKALEMHELYITMRDSINSIENKEATIKLEYQHKYEKEQALAEAKHQEQMILSAERAKRHQFINYSAGGGLVMVLLFAIFIFNRLQVTRRQKKVIQEQKEMVEEQKKDITDSIRYAENIQRALLPTIESINTVLPDSFVLFKPKDIVSGDFYWMQHHKDKVYFAACDCTGHGVPGAFMSMIGSSLLDEAVIEKGITKPNEIFFEVRKGFINALKQSGASGQQKDGMDAVLCSWDQHGNLEYALAYNPLLLFRNGELIETKPDKQPVGFHTMEQKPFTDHTLKLDKGDTVYIFSDGYPDQFGGPKNKKFMMKNFKKLLLSIQDKTMNEQKTILEDTMKEWKGDTEQIDDILVMGVRF